MVRSLVCGNGGSAADKSIVGELMKVYKKAASGRREGGIEGLARSGERC